DAPHSCAGDRVSAVGESQGAAARLRPLPQGVQLRPATRGSRWRCAGGPLRAITATAAGAALGTAIPLSRGLRPGVSVEARLPAVERTRHLPELGPGGRNP